MRVEVTGLKKNIRRESARNTKDGDRRRKKKREKEEIEERKKGK